MMQRRPATEALCLDAAHDAPRDRNAPDAPFTIDAGPHQECTSQSPVEACYECCENRHPETLERLLRASADQCACGTCSGSCPCPLDQLAPPDPTCTACLRDQLSNADAGACGADFLATCAADTDCLDIMTCRTRCALTH